MVNMLTNTELDWTRKRMIEECLLFGKLAEDDPTLPKLGVNYGKSVSFAKMEGPQKIVFYIEPLSTEPELLRNTLGKKRDEVYISFDVNNKRYLERIGYFEKEDKVAFLREHFQGKRILFKPVLNYDKNNSRYHYNFEIVLVEKMDTPEEANKRYVPIPVLSNSMTSGRFERRLVDGKPIELPSYNHALDIPEFIICDGYIYHIPDESVFQKYEVNDHVYVCRQPEEIKRVPVPENFENTMKMMHREIAFTSEDNRLDWIDLKNNKGVSVTEVIEEKSSISITSNQAITHLSKELENYTQNENIPEYAFIHRLDFLARKKKLRYSLDDLYNFHTSLKTSNFTILGGMSGTGKTQLALLYAEALKMVEGDNLLFIPVQPSYTEPSDLLGFLNQQTGVYLESEVGLVSFLKRASQNPEKMHMVLFDEMNLGQVEHYFSDFISLLEIDGEEKTLRLFSPDSNCVQTHLREGITIGNNILFVGTANFDETTRDFSNRMLDRSNVIILEKLSFVDAQKYELEDIKDVNDYVNQEKNDMLNPDQEITASNYNAWIRGHKSLSTLKEHELSVLDKLHEEISNFDSQTGVSFRIAKQIGYYLENIPKDEADNDFLSRTTAFDYQIKQRILSKIRGHQEQIGNLVGRYEDEYEYVDGRISIILSGEEKINCNKSIDYLKQKAKELMRNGYTL